MLKNNLVTLIIHFILVLALGSIYTVLNYEGRITVWLTGLSLLGSALSFACGFVLKIQDRMSRNVLSTASLLITPILLLPIYAINKNVLHAIYFYLIFHYPLDFVALFFNDISVPSVFILSLIPYFLCTFAFFIKLGYSTKFNFFIRSKTTSALAMLSLLVALTGCNASGGNIHLYWKEPAVQTSYAEAYELKVLFVHGEHAVQSDAALQHLQQTLYANTTIDTLSIKEVSALDQDYDLIYLDVGLDKNPMWEYVQPMIMSYVEQGSSLFLQHHYNHAFPHEFLGIQEMVEVRDSNLDFEYPELGTNVSGLQKAWKTFAEIYKTYRGLNENHHITFEHAARVTTARPLVQKDGLAYLTINDWGKGQVMWSNQFLPSERFGSRLDLVLEEGQKYFHMGWTTANLLFRSEIVNYISKEKYGFSVKKTYGAYGRPSLAWQAHYEALYSYVLRDLIKWNELLQTYNQIPTYSIVRGAYNGGQWNEAIRIHENLGTNEHPAFQNVYPDSFFSAGKIVTQGNNYVWFDVYPGYHSFLAPISEPFRAYPAIVNEKMKTVYDLIVGSADGTLHGLERAATTKQPENVKRQPLRNTHGDTKFVASYASPTVIDWNQDGVFDLLVGSGEGTVSIYIQEASGTFKHAGLVESEGEVLSVSGPSSPHAADWDRDGLTDLLVGDANGDVYWYKGIARDETGYQFHQKTNLEILKDQKPVVRHAAPFVYDWNRDGFSDLLVGSYEGDVRIYLQTRDGQLTKVGEAEGKTSNFFGTNTIKTGHYSVPIVMDWNQDGIDDLLTGHLEYGNTYSVDSPYFPYQQDLRDSLSYARDHYLPLIPHMYLHEYMSGEQELQEMKLHKLAFRNLGLPWDNDMGVNHHTWRINNNPLQTFTNQMNVGIWWNFGFNPPNISSAPRDGKEFLMVAPFMLANSNNHESEEPYKPFLLFAPAPHPLNYPMAWNGLAEYDIPLTMFEHVEHGLRPFTSVYDKLIDEIEFMDVFRADHNYSFMTEDQMARSLLNTFYGKVEVRFEHGKLAIRTNMDHVPANVKEYANTLGVKIELGDKYRHLAVNSSSPFHYEDQKGCYIGLFDEITAVEFTEQSAESNYIRVVATNSPVEIRKNGDQMTLLLTAKGMQEIKLYSPLDLSIQGDRMKVKRKGNLYQIVHFGEKMEVNLQSIQND
ncbi:VCBS repeat-containing protein [Paenibacillus sp.]|uniref:FG-GAP repeat domain-containing protein n=1 Tax=Paenibacillus sp. TaxID=58172 RepID=UPI002810DCFD|nr:VCBS repeat-containing protein [Paenibacillus sp.]